SGADPTGESFYFLEMNTRLQVEHPVTEAITGIDLVEWMIRVAAGEKLPMTQGDISINGWSIENRIYAEDPYRGFLPSTGRLVRLQFPEASHFAAPDETGHDEGYTRIDSGVQEGGEVSIFYDPMIAKLVTWAPTRDEAADLQVEALDRIELDGLGHNVDFLSALMQHPRFRSGELTTGFIAEEYPDGFEGAAVSEQTTRVLAAVTGVIATADADRSRRVTGQLGHPLPPPGDWTVRIGDVDHEVTLAEDGILVNGEPVVMEFDYTPGDRIVDVSVFEGTDEDAELLTSYGIRLRPTRLGYRMTTHGAQHDVRVLQRRHAQLAQHMIEKEPPDTSKMLLCPMPGLLVKLHVEKGEAVETGQPLATVEAMKMENILRAEKAGTVATINAEEGETLVVDAVILELE
ncbi:MAG: biotin/lipoyl-containing protein, partial [Alteraurantiacibacter sp.]